MDVIRMTTTRLSHLVGRRIIVMLYGEYGVMGDLSLAYEGGLLYLVYGVVLGTYLLRMVPTWFTY